MGGVVNLTSITRTEDNYLGSAERNNCSYKAKCQV